LPVKYVNKLGLKWEPMPWAPVQERLKQVLGPWLGTPYMKGQRCKGSGVDCVRFVTGVLDELYGFERVSAPKLPQDVALHSRATAIGAMKALLEIYPFHEEVTGPMIQPGDIIVVGPLKGGPGHVMIVGPRRNTLWHSHQPIGVQITGLAFNEQEQEVFKIYRLQDRHSWASP